MQLFQDVFQIIEFPVFWSQTANMFSDMKDKSEVLTHKNSENRWSGFYFTLVNTLTAMLKWKHYRVAP